MSITDKSVGVFLYPDNFSGAELATAARRSEELGYQSVPDWEALEALAGLR
jgi:hypothetical protein